MSAGCCALVAAFLASNPCPDLVPAMVELSLTVPTALAAQTDNSTDAASARNFVRLLPRYRFTLNPHHYKNAQA